MFAVSEFTLENINKWKQIVYLIKTIFVTKVFKNKQMQNKYWLRALVLLKFIHIIYYDWPDYYKNIKVNQKVYGFATVITFNHNFGYLK